MAGKSAVMSVRIVADAKQASGELSRFERAIDGVESTLDKLTPYAAAAGAGLVAFGTMAVNAAAEAEQNFGAVETVFKGAADTVHAYAEQAANAVGMSSSSYEALAASIGGSLSKAGYSQDELAQKTNDLINAGADLSSVFGGDAKEASEAMGAALRGEFDSLERFGVFMSASAVEARMAAEGTDQLTGAAYEAAKKQATVNEIMEQAGAYAGNFAREADTAAGAQQRASAAYQDAVAALGEALLPTVTAVANKLAEMARWASENTDVIQTLGLGIGIFAAAVFAGQGALMAYNGAQAAIKIATQGWTAAQWVLNAALNANPIGLIVIAIAALVAAFIWAYNNVDWFRQGVDDALAWIGQAWDNTTRWISDTWNGAVNFVKEKWDGAVSWVSEKYNGLTNSARNAGSKIKQAYDDAANRVKNTWNGAITWVKNGFTNAQNVARSVVQGIVNYFRSLGNSMRNTFSGIISWINSIRNRISNIFSGFRLPSMPGWAKKLIGASGMPGMAWDSERGHYYAPRPEVLEAPFMLTADRNALLAPLGGLTPSVSAQQTTNVTVNFNGFVSDPLATAREIKRLLNQHTELVGA